MRLFIVLRLFLALSLALTSVHSAPARAEARAAMDVVICAGGGLLTVALDADGKPVTKRHVCPDCVLGGMAVLAGAVTPAPPVILAARLSHPEAATILAARSALQPSARGPPGLV